MSNATLLQHLAALRTIETTEAHLSAALKQSRETRELLTHAVATFVKNGASTGDPITDLCVANPLLRDWEPHYRQLATLLAEARPNCLVLIEQVGYVRLKDDVIHEVKHLVYGRLAANELCFHLDSDQPECSLPFDVAVRTRLWHWNSTSKIHEDDGEWEQLRLTKHRCDIAPTLEVGPLFEANCRFTPGTYRHETAPVLRAPGAVQHVWIDEEDVSMRINELLGDPSGRLNMPLMLSGTQDPQLFKRAVAARLLQHAKQAAE